MYIGTPGLWTGFASGEWNMASNWHNFKVPPTSLSVVIPANAINWPHLTGDLTIGVLCPNITILDTAQLIVDGDLTINSRLVPDLFRCRDPVPGRRLVEPGYFYDRDQHH